MKKLILLLFILPIVAFANSDPLIKNVKATPFCVTGSISNIRYNNDNTMSVIVGQYNLYTTRLNLQPLLAGAMYIGAPVTIYTNSCYYGGGFAEVTFTKY